MSHESEIKNESDNELRYQIRLEGHLDGRWADWFGQATIDHQENGESLITCSVPDQAALYGLLRKVRDLGMPLLSVVRITGKRATLTSKTGQDR